jgi:hypothetical protein
MRQAIFVNKKQEMKHNEGLRVSKFLNLKLLPFPEWDRDESDESWVEWLNPWNYCVTESILILCENSVSVAEQMYTVLDRLGFSRSLV